MSDVDEMGRDELEAEVRLLRIHARKLAKDLAEARESRDYWRRTAEAPPPVLPEGGS